MSKTSADDTSNQAVLSVLISTLPPLGMCPAAHTRGGEPGDAGGRPTGQRRLSAGSAEAFRPAVSRTVYARFPARDRLFRTCEETLTAASPKRRELGQCARPIRLPERVLQGVPLV